MMSYTPIQALGRSYSTALVTPEKLAKKYSALLRDIKGIHMYVHVPSAKGFRLDAEITVGK